MNKRVVLFFLSVICHLTSVIAQDAWTIKATNINPSAYFGETVANGMIGIVSSPDPFKVKDVVLNGAFDLYGRGRVSNILKTFNFLNMYLDVDGQRIESFKQVQNVQQTLDMKHANLTTTFDYGDKAYCFLYLLFVAAFALYCFG